MQGVSDAYREADTEVSHIDAEATAAELEDGRPQRDALALQVYLKTSLQETYVGLPHTLRQRRINEVLAAKTLLELMRLPAGLRCDPMNKAGEV